MFDEEVWTLAKTFKACYRNGVIEPLEPLSLDEGKEVTVTVIESERDTVHS